MVKTQPTFEPHGLHHFVSHKRHILRAPALQRSGYVAIATRPRWLYTFSFLVNMDTHDAFASEYVSTKL